MPTNSGKEEAGISLKTSDAADPHAHGPGRHTIAPAGRIEVEVLKSIAEHSRSEFDRVHKWYRWGAAIMGIVVILGLYFTYDDAATYRTEVREDAKNQIEQIQQKMGIAEEQLQLRLDSLGEAVAERIDKEFNAEHIRAMVMDAATVRTREIADGLIEQKVTSATESRLATVSNEIAGLETRIESIAAEAASATDVVRAMLLAQADDRPAFDQLGVWARDEQFAFRTEAAQVRQKILETHDGPLVFQHDVPWKPGIDPNALSLEVLRQAYARAPARTRQGLVTYIWGRKDFPEHERVAFLAHVLSSDKSLQVVAAAGRRLREVSGQALPALAVDEYLDWWEGEKGRTGRPNDATTRGAER